MKEIEYQFIKSQAKATQNILFDALAYRSAFGELPEGLSDKHLNILNLIIEYERLCEDYVDKTVEHQEEHQAIQYKRGAPKGNRNNKWCRMKDSGCAYNVEQEIQTSTNQSTKEYKESTKEVQKEYNSGTNQSTNNTKEVQMSTIPSTNEYNSEYKSSTKEKESEKENVSPSHTLPLIKEKESEKENVQACEDGTDKDVVVQPLMTLKAEVSPPAPKPKRTGTFSLSVEELSDIDLFVSRFPFIERQHAPAMMKWLTYKKERQQSYKSDTSLKTCYNQYLRKCNGNVDVGMQVVENSIGNNWSGLFEVKNNNQSKYGTYQQDNGRAEREAEVNARLEELLSDTDEYDEVEARANAVIEASVHHKNIWG